MDIAALFLHNLREGTCPAWGCIGETPEEKARIDETMRAFVDYEQDPGFNEWRFSTWGNGEFYVKRFTWETVWIGPLDDMLEKVKAYYQKRA